MKLDDTFHMRRLDEQDLEQFNALLRYAFQVTTTEMVKTGWSEEEIKREKVAKITGEGAGGERTSFLADRDLSDGSQCGRRNR